MKTMKLKSRIGLTIAFLVFAFFVPGVRQVGAVSTSTTLCASKESGAVRVSRTGRCKSSELKLLIGREGPVGPTGPAGGVGPVGSYTGIVGIRSIAVAATNLELSDVGKVLIIQVGTEIAIPVDSSVPFPIGTRVEIARTTGSATIKPASGVTVNGVSFPGVVGFDTSAQYQLAVLLKTAANTWVFLRIPDPNNVL